MRRYLIGAAKTVGPLLVAILLFQLNDGVIAQTTGPPTTLKTAPPTTTQPGQVTGTHPETSTTVEPDESTTTATTRHKRTTTTRKRSGALARTGPGDDAGNFRLWLFIVAGICFTFAMIIFMPNPNRRN